MKLPIRLHLLISLLSLPALAQNSDLCLLVGPAFGSTQTIGGSNVTVNGSTGWTFAVGGGFQVIRKGSAGLWVEPFPVIFQSPGGSATSPGPASAESDLLVPSVRFMFPVQSRISLFVAAGAGGGKFGDYSLTSDVPPKLKTSTVYHGVVGGGGGADFRISRHFAIRVDVRDYVTGRGLGGVNGRNHFAPLLGIAWHY